MHVLILGARAPACLEWARAFDVAGWRVTVADSLAYPLARASSAVSAYLRLPEPCSSPMRWVDAIADAVLRRGIDLVLPTCEEVFYLSYGKDRIPCRVFTSGFELMHRLHHKGWFADMTKDWPVRAPVTTLLHSLRDLSPLRATSREWVFKPAYSRFATHALIRPGQDALRKVSPSESHPWVAQRFVAGREHCSYSLLVDGRVTAHACYRSRYRVGHGSAVWFESTDPVPVRAMVERVGAETRYTGQLAFDFIESVDGSWHVLECNPRATSGVHLLGGRPQALVAALLGDGVMSPLGDERPHMVAMAMLSFVAFRRGLSGGFWRDYSRARDVVYRSGDRMPFFCQWLGLAEVSGRALARGLGLLSAATADIEWNGQAMDGSS